MSKTVLIHARVEPEIKEQAEILLKRLGVSTSEAINMFLNQIILNNGLPFDVKIPNAQTLEAMAEGNFIIESGKGRFDNVEDMLKELKN